MTNHPYYSEGPYADYPQPEQPRGMSGTTKILLGVGIPVTVLSLAAVAIVVHAVAGKADTTPAEDQKATTYFSLLEKESVPHDSDREVAIKEATDVCDALSKDTPLITIALQRYAKPKYDREAEQEGSQIIAAVMRYCPEYTASVLEQAEKLSNIGS